MAKSGEGAGGRNKTVDYYLTEKGEQEYRLKILQYKSNSKRDVSKHKESREDKYGRLYRLLLFLANFAAKIGELFTEEDLDKFLIKIGKSRSDLTIKEVYRTRGKVKLIVTKFNPISEDIMIYKHEKPTDEGNQFIRYAYNYGGVSTSEVIKLISKEIQGAIGGGDLTEGDITESIMLLEQEGLLTKITVENGDTAYILADRRLRNFMIECMFFLEKTTHNLVWRLNHISRPTKDEIEWLKMLWGPTRTDIVLREAYYIRHSFTKKKANYYT